MATPQSRFPFLNGANGFFARLAAGPQLASAPPWLVHGVQRRLVLLVNHVLMQESEAMERLRRQKGRVLRAQWRGCALALLVTPAGLFDLAPEAAAPDLRLELGETSALALARHALRGDKPAIRIEGDVQLAAEINWLVDHLRWDLEEDLARVIGDAPAHLLAQCAGRAAQALRHFAAAAMPTPAPAPHSPAMAPMPQAFVHTRQASVDTPQASAHAPEAFARPPAASAHPPTPSPPAATATPAPTPGANGNGRAGA